MSGLHEFADRFRTWILAGLLILDLASLLLMIVIALNQSTVNDELTGQNNKLTRQTQTLDDQANKLAHQTKVLHHQAVVNHIRACRNSGILIADARQKQAQSSNKQLFRQLFPSLTPMSLDALIARSVAQTKAEIAQLSRGCTGEQLSVPELLPSG